MYIHFPRTNSHWQVSWKKWILKGFEETGRKQWVCLERNSTKGLWNYRRAFPWFQWALERPVQQGGESWASKMVWMKKFWGKYKIINEKKSRTEVGTVLHNGKPVIFKMINKVVRNSKEMQTGTIQQTTLGEDWTSQRNSTGLIGWSQNGRIGCNENKRGRRWHTKCFQLWRRKTHGCQWYYQRKVKDFILTEGRKKRILDKPNWVGPTWYPLVTCISCCPKKIQLKTEASLDILGPLSFIRATSNKGMRQ